ncbi:low-density lipoprotein receptor 2-like [Littorina saxatilis]|uniref:CUB domain-containing protein n=1 Tax=Littorina saxatilis TaxID=31220 RepID=A0AAN9ATX5_9CAEN
MAVPRFVVLCLTLYQIVLKCKVEACGGNLTSLTGTVQSPNFPNNYTNGLSCVYVIKAPDGYRVTLNFTSFDVEAVPNCLSDFVEVRDGDNEDAPRIGQRMCNTSPPSTRRSFHNNLWVKFVTNNNGTRAGFSAIYTAEIIPDSFFLIAATSVTSVGGSIFLMDTETRSNYIIPMSPSLLNPIALDYDPVEKRIFWTEVGIVNHIRSAGLTGGRAETVFDAGKDAVLDGLAVDHVSRLIFYTDTVNKLVAMVTMSTLAHKTVVNSSLDKPRAIVLDTSNGVMFWTDWGGPAKIERANYDGSDRRTLVNSYLLAINALALDVASNRLYWADAGTDLVEYSDLEGEGRTVLLNAQKTRHFFGLALFQDSLYITDWGPEAVQTKLSLIVRQTVDGRNVTVFGSVPLRLNDIHIYHAQPSEPNGCGSNNGGCSVFCIPLPGNSSKCTCPDGQSLVSDGKSCVNDEDLSSTTDVQTSTGDENPSLNVPLVAGAAAGGVVVVVVLIIIVVVVVRKRRHPLYDRPKKTKKKKGRRNGDDDENPYTGLGSVRNEPFVVSDSLRHTEGVTNPPDTRDSGRYSSEYVELDDTALDNPEAPTDDYLHPTPCSWSRSKPTSISYIHAEPNPDHVSA